MEGERDRVEGVRWARMRVVELKGLVHVLLHGPVGSFLKQDVSCVHVF